MPELRRTLDENRGDDTVRTVQRTAALMKANIIRIKQRTLRLPENSLVYRNDILLPQILIYCIVVCEMGLRTCPESPLFIGTDPAKRLTPRLDRSYRPIVKSKVI